MTRLYRKLLIGYLDDGRGREAVALARALADPSGAELIAAHVTPIHGYFADVEAIGERDVSTKAAIERALAELAPGLRADARVLAGPSAAGTLYRLAEDEDADLVVLGSSHRGAIGRVLLGSTADALLHGAPCPVAVAPRGFGAEREMRTVGVAYDGGAQAEAALAAAAGIGRTLGARLRLVAVVRPPSEYVPPVAGPPLRTRESPELLERARAEMQRKLDAALDALPDGVAREGVVLVGTPEDELRGEAARSCDLLVVGSRGYGPVASVLLGSTSRRLVRDCAVPVLVVPIARGDG